MLLSEKSLFSMVNYISLQSDLSRPDMGSLELQSHGQATDDMDTQPPLLYMDSRLADQAIQHVLEQVSEDDDEPVSFKSSHCNEMFATT